MNYLVVSFIFSLYFLFLLLFDHSVVLVGDFK